MQINGLTNLKTRFIRKSLIESPNLMRFLTKLRIDLQVSFICSPTFYLELQNAFDMECETRIEREKDIMQEVDDAKYALLKKIDAERTDKSLSLGLFKDQTLSTLNKQHKYIEEF
jgi:hypothetical protein